jgi:hypothetical protein
LLYNDADIEQLNKNLEQNSPSVKEIQQVYHYLGNYFQLAYGAGERLVYNFDLGDFCKRYQLEVLKTLSALKILERQEHIALSESVYLPSRLKILADTETLYKFQIAQPSYDGLIKTLLRSYGGLFEQFVAIKESELSKRANLSTHEVRQMLEKMQELELLSYSAQTDQPQLQLGMYPVDDPQAVRGPRPDVSYTQSGTNGLQILLTDSTAPNGFGYPSQGSRDIQWGWNPVGGARAFDTALTPNYLAMAAQVGTVTIQIGV